MPKRSEKATRITCIYCLESKSASAFKKREHVLPESFGSFKNNLTLHDVVCDDCNQLLGDELELYLARDTPHGLTRYLIGGKDPREFKSLGNRSSLVTRVQSGPFKGAFAAVKVGDDGTLGGELLPQVGFGKSAVGPHQWFTLDKLPSREDIKALADEGIRHLRGVGIDDHGPILAELQKRGVNLSGDVETSNSRLQSTERFETQALLGMQFGRAITKIGLNYLAHQYGPAIARMPAFNNARRFVRWGGDPKEERIWSRLEHSFDDSAPLGHRVSLHQQNTRVFADISLHNTEPYQIALTTSLRVILAGGERAHFFDLSSMTARKIK
jgi:hypothetical protein